MRFLDRLQKQFYASLWLALAGSSLPAAFSGSVVYCQEISEAAIVDCLNANTYVTLLGKAHAKIDGRQLSVALYQDPRATITDLKINSVLLAKGLFDRYADTFDSFVFSYFPLSAQSNYCEAKVNRADIEDFAHGALSHAQLLRRIAVEPFLAASLKRRYQSLSYAEIIGENQVVDGVNGPHSKDRKEIKARILSLKASGYDVSVAERQFLKMEDLVRRKDRFDYADYEAASKDVELCLQDSINNGTAPRKIRLASDERSLWQR